VSGAHRNLDAPADGVPGDGVPGDGARGDFTRPPAPPGSQLTWESTVTAPTEFVPYVYTDAEVNSIQARRRTSMASVVCGGLGLLLGIVGVWGILLSIAAVVLALMARSSEHRARNLWMTGLVTGIMGCALALGWFLYVTQVVLG